MRYFTSDLHIGDETIARWRGFEDVAAHDEMVLAHLAEGLREDDELWILGDVCRPNVDSVRAVRRALPCKSVSVIVGNHDIRAKFETCGSFSLVEYYDEVGKVVRDGYKFVLCHYPMLDWNRAHWGSYMLHGHIHSLPRQAQGGPASYDEGGFGMRGYNELMRERRVRRLDVGVDAWGYRPVSDAQIVGYFEEDGPEEAMT